MRSCPDANLASLTQLRVNKGGMKETGVGVRMYACMYVTMCMYSQLEEDSVTHRRRVGHLDAPVAGRERQTVPHHMNTEPQRDTSQRADMNTAN